MSGFVSAGGGEGAVGAIKMEIVGGTVAEIGGGKFANGAMGSAFQYLFNDFLSKEEVSRWRARQNASVKGIEKTLPNQQIYNQGDGQLNIESKVLLNSMASTGVIDTFLSRYLPFQARIAFDSVIFGGALIFHSGGNYGSWENATFPDYTENVIDAIPSKKR